MVRKPNNAISLQITTQSGSLHAFCKNNHRPAVMFLTYILAASFVASLSFQNVSGFPRVKEYTVKNVTNETKFKLGNGRSERYLFPFVMINFSAEPCGATNTVQAEGEGVCSSRKRCSTSGGDSIGTCQQGLGTCCKFTKQCNANMRSVAVVETVENLISSSVEGSCEFLFPKQPGICQVRLDFVSAMLADPATTGASASNCQSESLTITGSSNLNGPLRVCGRLTGQHMILSYGATQDLISMSINSETSAPSYTIRATQIPCNSPNKAPDDCLQYFTNPTSAVKSFGFPRQLNNQKYTICVKPTSGANTLSWDLCTESDVNAANAQLADRFFVSTPAIPPTQCTTDWLFLGTTMRCGDEFTQLQTDVLSYSRILVNFDENETGDNVFFPQIPAGNPDEPAASCEKITFPDPVFVPLPQSGRLMICAYVNMVCECYVSNMPDNQAIAFKLQISPDTAQPAGYMCPEFKGYIADPSGVAECAVGSGTYCCSYYADLRIADSANTGFCLRYQAS